MTFRKYNTMLLVVIIPLLFVLSNCVPTVVKPQTQMHRKIYSAFDQGKARYESGDYESALEFFLKATKSEPTNWIPYNWLGWTYITSILHQIKLEK